MSGLREWLTKQVALDAKQAFTARQREEAALKDKILEFHKAWPVLVEQEEPPWRFDRLDSSDPNKIIFRATHQITWMTEQEYVKRFGVEPPTAPMLRAMASIYRDRPGFQDEWLGQ